MSDAFQDLTAAPILYNIKDTSYEVSPLTQGDWAALCRFAQYMPYHSLQQEMPDCNKTLLNDLLKDCAKNPVRMGSDELDNWLVTHEGVKETVFLSLHHKHPKLQRNDLIKFEQKDVVNMATIATHLSLLTNDEVDDGTKKKATEILNSVLDRLKSENKTK